MEQVITAKLKLHADAGQRAQLRRTQLAYRDALNYVSAYAFDHGKTSNQMRLQRETYATVRGDYGLPAQMACNIPRQVGATYKALWTKARVHAAGREAGLTTTRFKGLDAAPRYTAPTLTYNYRRDYSFKTESRVSVLTLEGRLVLPYSGYATHTALLREGAQIGAAKLWYDQPRRTYYLLVSLAIQKPDPTPDSVTGIVGVDVGQRYLAVTSASAGRASFYSGARATRHNDHLAKVRKTLQRKGTRSATRRLKAIGRRERRQQAAANHTVAKRIVAAHPAALIGVEDLAHVRERTPRKRGKKASKAQRTANRRAARWPFAQLQGFMAYKAALGGGRVIWVDAHYTSQACPRCGFTSKGNRPNKGLTFRCQACQYTLHADLVGARNIALRTLLIRQDWVRTGGLSVCPDVSDEEAKAARRRRYAELRWSPEASPRLQPRGH